MIIIFQLQLSFIYYFRNGSLYTVLKRMPLLFVMGIKNFILESAPVLLDGLEYTKLDLLNKTK